MRDVAAWQRLAFVPARVSRLPWHALLRHEQVVSSFQLIRLSLLLRFQAASQELNLIGA